MGKLMNRKAQATFGISVVVGIFLFLVSMIFINFIRNEVSGTPDGSPNLITALNCDATGISDGNMADCLIAELIVPYSIAIFIGTAGGILVSRLIV